MRTSKTSCACPDLYSGQPSGGFFFESDFFTASFQLPSSFSTSGLGPRLAGFLAVFGLAVFFTAYIVTVGCLYISRFPSAPLIPAIVRSPSLSWRLFQRKSYCQR